VATVFIHSGHTFFILSTELEFLLSRNWCCAILRSGGNMADCLENQVLLVGCIVGEIVDRELASGELISQWRVKVARIGESGSDSIPCSTSVAAVRKSLSKASLASDYQIEGQIRSRYWNAAGVTGSRVEVNVTKMRKFKPGLSP
jgi:hypothetical protein